MLQEILNGLEHSFPLLFLFILMLGGLAFLAYSITVWKIDTNIEKVETRLMTSINTVKIEMIQNAKDIKVGVDKDVVMLKSEQDGLSKQQEGLSKQMEEVKFNIHGLKNNMVQVQHDVKSMSRSVEKVHGILRLIYAQNGGNLNDVIKESLDSLED